MTSSPTYSKSLNDFLITLNLTDSVLSIEAENQSTFRVYNYEVNAENVSKLTDHLYPDISSFYNGLKDTLENQRDEAKSSIDQNAKLSFIYSLAIGAVTRKWEFSIRLDEVKFDRTEKLEREVGRLRKQVDEITKVFAVKEPSELQNFPGLFKRMSEMESSSAEQKKKSEELEKMIGFSLELEKTKLRCLIGDQGRGSDDFQRVDCVFDPNSTQKTYFDLSNSDKRITRNNTSNGSWFAMFTKDALSSTGKYKFSVKIEKSAAETFAIGLAAGSLKGSTSCYSSSGAFFYEFSGNRFYHNGSNVQIPLSIKTFEGDMFHFLIDVDKQIIRVDINEITLLRLKVDLSTSNNTGLYPCVHLTHNPSSVTFM